MSNTAVAQQSLVDTRVDDAQFESLMRKMMPAGTYSPAVKEVRSLISKGDLDGALRLCDELIAKPIDTFDNPYYGSNVKANAYNYKASIAQQTGGNPDEIIRNIIEAIKLGHVEAAEYFALNVLKRQPDFISFVQGLSKEELAEIFKAGASLGEPFSAAAIGIANIPMDIKSDERLYWFLFAVMRDKGISRAERQKILSAAIERMTIEKVGELLSRFSLVDYPIEKSKIGLPGRGIMETLFADSDLRGSLGGAHGNKRDPADRPPIAPTVREQFDFYSRIVPEVGFGDVYLVVAGSPTLHHPRVVGAGKSAMLAELSPGDRVFLDCGPLSHVAFFFRRDNERKRLLFLDPNYEFWHPSHNSCVTSHELVEGLHKRYLSSIPEIEVAEMLSAVLTMRDKR